MQVAAIEQRLHQHRHAADIVEVLHHIAPAGLQIGDVGGAPKDLADIVQIKFDADLVGHCRQMEPGIGRAAGGGNDGRGIFERLAGDDVARAQIAAHEVHHCAARGFGEGVARVIGRRRARRAGQCQTDRLGDAGHRVGGELATARAGRRTGDAFELMQLVIGKLADAVRPDRLEDIAYRHVMPVKPARQNRAAIHKDRGHIEP